MFWFKAKANKTESVNKSIETNKETKTPQNSSLKSNEAVKSNFADANKPKPVVSKKKFFFMDADYLAVVLLLVIVLFGAKVYGLSISAPETVEITNKAVFTVDLVNDSDSAANITVNFFSPAKSEITAPRQLAPNSTSKATITIYNNINKVQDITSTVEVSVGEQKIQKQVILSFKENPTGSLAGAFSALFSFGLFNKEVASFSGIDWVAFWVLVIIAAVLVVAFVSRLVRRV